MLVVVIHSVNVRIGYHFDKIMVLVQFRAVVCVKLPLIPILSCNLPLIPIPLASEILNQARRRIFGLICCLVL